MKRRLEFEGYEPHWYAIDVVRQKEYVAGLFFQRMGCATFIPTEMRFRKKNRYTKGKIEVAHAAIPGVVFVGFPGAPNWYRVMSMDLVNGVLSADDKPRRIDTASPEWIRYRAHQLDGSLTVERQRVWFRGGVVERSAALVQVQGRGVIRSPISLKAQASSSRPVVVTAVGQRAVMLGSLLAKANGTPHAMSDKDLRGPTNRFISDGGRPCDPTPAIRAEARQAQVSEIC